MQILVVVANIQPRNLKAEVEKGSPTPVFGWGSVDPKILLDAIPEGLDVVEPTALVHRWREVIFVI